MDNGLMNNNSLKERLKRVISWVRNITVRKLHYKSEDLPYYLTIVVAIVIFFIGLRGFIELTDELAENELGQYDDAVSQFVQSFRTDFLTVFFRVVSDLGDRYAYAGLAAALATFFWFRFQNWKFTVQIVAVLILSSLSNIALKNLINRSRPSVEHLVTVNTLSFPSGHSMSAMAFYGFMIYLCLRFKMSKALRTFLITILAVLILAIGISRIYLGVHYPSDVAAGFMGGLIWVTLCAIIFNVFELWRKRKKSAREQTV